MLSLFDSIVRKTHNKAYGLALNYYSPNKTLKKPIEPIVFQKALSSLVYKPEILNLISPSKINHEVELGVMIGERCHKIQENDAMKYIGGYFLLFDLTANIINNYRKEGKSFCLAKNGDGFFVVGDFIEKNLIPNPKKLNLELKVNSSIRQSGNTDQMIFSISEQLTYLSKFFVLNKGDLILTGTPDGIDFFESGDVLEAKMTDTDCKVLSELKVKVNYDVFDPTYSTKIEALIKPKNCI